MIYRIPDELVPYLEYIPEEMLGDIITDALRAAIFAEPVELSDNKQQLDITQIMEQLQALSFKDTTTKATKERSEPSSGSIVRGKIGDDDIPDDIKSVVEDLAGSIFK